MAPGWFFRRSDGNKPASSSNSRASSVQFVPRDGGPAAADDELGFGQKLMGPTGSNFSSSAASSSRLNLKEARYADLRYTKFVIDGFVGEKHAVFIPDSLTLSMPVLKQICNALDIQAPSLLLSGMSSLCHPARMSNLQLRNCAGFKQLVEEAKTSIGGEDAADEDKRLVEVVDRVLEKKLSAAVACVAIAAKRTNAWTFTGPQITNLEMFLQQCIESSDSGENPGEANVFRMAVAHLQDRSYMESPTSMQMMKDLFDNSQEMSSEGVSYFQPILLKGDLWDPGLCASSPEFAEYGFDHWSFNGYDQKLTNGHPITLWPWPHANLFLLFYKEANSWGRTSEVDWYYRTPRRLDPEAVPFNPEVLAPLGHVFFGAPVSWGTRTKKRLLRGMKLTRPVVMMDNTPNVAKHVCLCIEAVKKVWDPSPLVACKPFLDDVAGAKLSSTPTTSEILQALSPSRILQHVRDSFDASGMDVQEKLTLSDIVGILDIAKKRPRAFREMLCLVDPLADPSESLALVMATLSSHQMGSKDANPSTVHRSLVLKAWGLHVKLTRNELYLRRSLTAINVFTALALVFSTAIAMVMASIDSQESLSGWKQGVCHGLHMSLIALPISAALLTIIRNNFQITQKWAEAHMATHKLVSEIYHFLGDVGPYNAGSTASQRRFLRRLQGIEKRCSGGPMAQEEDLGAGWEKVFRDEPERLQEHVNSSLYASRSHLFSCRCLRHLGSLVGRGNFPWTRLLLDTEPHDMASPVTAETYMEIRIVPLRKYFTDMVRTLTRSQIVLHAAVGIFLVMSLLLAAIGAPAWIPIAIALTAFAAGTVHWVAPAETFTALSSALDTLSGFEDRWNSTDIVVNRSLATKVDFIKKTEHLALQVARSFSTATVLPELFEGEDMDSETEAVEKAPESSIAEQRKRPIIVEIMPPQDQASSSNTRDSS